jgi:hypothetical protein
MGHGRGSAPGAILVKKPSIDKGVKGVIVSVFVILVPLVWIKRVLLVTRHFLFGQSCKQMRHS